MSIQLLKGDCLERMKTLPDKSIDCFICDLPYGCLGNKRDKVECKDADEDGVRKIHSVPCSWDVKIDLTEFWKQVERLMKNDHTPILHFCTTKFGVELITSNPNWFRYDLVWNKERGVSFLSANKQPMRSHEMIYVFSKKGAYYKRIDIEGDYPNTNVGARPKNFNVYKPFGYTEKESNEGKRCVKSVVQVANKKTKGGHPTQKPTELYKWLLSRYCPEGGTILDPTAGSFSSCFAGRELGLNCIGIEKDDAFFEKAQKQAGFLNVESL